MGTTVSPTIRFRMRYLTKVTAVLEQQFLVVETGEHGTFIKQDWEWRPVPRVDIDGNPLEGRYSFDDLSFGWTNSGKELNHKLVQRPPGLTNAAWYKFVSELIRVLPGYTNEDGL